MNSPVVDPAHGFDAVARDGVVAVLSEMAAGDTEREKVIDTLRLMLVGQLEAWERLRHCGYQPMLVDGLGYRTAMLLVDVMHRTCCTFSHGSPYAGSSLQ